MKPLLLLTGTEPVESAAKPSVTPTGITGGESGPGVATVLTSSSDRIQPALTPAYQPPQPRTGARGGALYAGLARSAANAEPVNSSVAPTRPNTFLICVLRSRRNQ